MQLDFTVHNNDNGGLYYITCRQHRGLLVAKNTLYEALDDVSRALREIAECNQMYGFSEKDTNER